MFNYSKVKDRVQLVFMFETFEASIQCHARGELELDFPGRQLGADGLLLRPRFRNFLRPVVLDRAAGRERHLQRDLVRRSVD